MLGSDKMGKKTPAQGKGVAKKESTGTKKRQKSMFDFFGKSKPAATPVQRAARYVQHLDRKS
ncbi:hypothetical protein SARC_07639 [Sphaeroforma arctica JP610]|uniref:Uncharacterized protein n=1 Tax=Sphaeroforma arctica JP610 TaxID=667725 RepID=A0A0L0FTF9_9EUKA|nr:hypothetical protein SARC_07639 [Sphaeroforma arctica JP610]KNC79984.1 hypothetical protein SARC_07639 [Sphaeroforma arctica JP610]|eukprot:XP_014153886.1 hypothetical protein SARC_07639 [Sphaeroforma arctica JP610]